MRDRIRADKWADYEFDFGNDEKYEIARAEPRWMHLALIAFREERDWYAILGTMITSISVFGSP
jgi:hypothetical protein